ncbi:hypothetical protein MN608_03134 [Microdochium nivale]|nr:hypothetical protein MN608_03134 [Microdochium nivale]
MSFSSAIFGQPPATDGDYSIIRGIYRLYAIPPEDPAAGFVHALQAPPGYVFETQATSIVIGNVFVVLAMIIPTTARLVLRAKKDSVLRFGWDDWTILMAMIVGLGYPITQIVLNLKGVGGVHTWDLTYEQYRFGNAGAMFARSIFYVTVGLTKLSITLFVRRMVDRTSRRWRIFLDILLATMVAYIALAVLWNLFGCNPINAYWDLEVRGRPEPPVCTDFDLQSRVLATVHVAQGIVLLSTPIAFLWKVRINLAKKVRLYVIWIIGALAISGGILRELRLDRSWDISWNYTEILVWTSIELTLELLVASLPVLDSALVSSWHKASAHVADGISSRTHGTTTNSSSGGRHQRWTGGGYQPTSETSVLKAKAPITTAGMDKSESRENIVQHEEGRGSDDDGIQMAILRTQEVHMEYSPNSKFETRGPSSPRIDFRIDRPGWRQDVVVHPEPAVVGAARMQPDV